MQLFIRCSRAVPGTGFNVCVSLEASAGKHSPKGECHRVASSVEKTSTCAWRLPTRGPHSSCADVDMKCKKLYCCSGDAFDTVVVAEAAQIFEIEMCFKQGLAQAKTAEITPGTRRIATRPCVSRALPAMVVKVDCRCLLLTYPNKKEPAACPASQALRLELS